VAESLAWEASPPRKGIVEVSEEQDSCLIVLGSHGRTGLADVFMGSVGQDVPAHSRRPVLIFHRRALSTPGTT
jgi:nucleotide-binding universal stress UspA family protein